MRIVIGSKYHLTQYTGGNEIYADSLARELVAQRHEVYYLTHFGKSNTKLPYKLSIIKPSPSWFKTIENLKPDIVHMCGTGISMSLTGLFCRLKHIPCVSTFQAPLRSATLLQKINKLDEWFDVHVFTRLITTTPANNSYLHRYWQKAAIDTVYLSLKAGFPSQPPITVSNARESLHLEKNKKYILMVCSLDKHHYYKGISIAFQALTKLPNNYELILGGTGDTLPEYQYEAKKLGINQRIHFSGYISDEQLPLYYCAADGFILPSTSLSEGFGLVLLEAMTMETPVITTDVVGLSSILKEHQAAQIISSNNSTQLADAILQLPDKNSPQVIHAADYARIYSISRMTAATIACYEKAMKHYA